MAIIAGHWVGVVQTSPGVLVIDGGLTIPVEEDTHESNKPIDEKNTYQQVSPDRAILGGHGDSRK